MNKRITNQLDPLVKEVRELGERIEGLEGRLGVGEEKVINDKLQRERAIQVGQNALNKAAAFVKDAEFSKKGEKLLAACNVATYSAFEEFTGNKSLNGKLANDIFKHLSNSSEWQEIQGPQGVQDLANKGQYIIAARPEYGLNKKGLPRSGHVVLIIPGDEVISPTWGGGVPICIDAGANRRWLGFGINKSWSVNIRDNVHFFLYKGPIVRK